MKIASAARVGLICLSGASLAPSVAAVTLRKGPLDTPDTTGYVPVTVLCSKGKKVQGWCKDWLSCIKAKAQPESDPAAVLKAWSPAECKEMCGVFPATTGPEGTNLLQGRRANVSSTAAERLLSLTGARSVKDCVDSCANFQDKLSTCVAKILFEPGQVANMGMPSGDPPKKGPAYCTSKDTPCVPDLPIRHHKCVSVTARSVWRKEKLDPMVEKQCKMVLSDVEHCEDCPALDSGAMSEYAAFAGGCMTQLNLYWQATHPDAKAAGIPGAKGCQVH